MSDDPQRPSISDETIFAGIAAQRREMESELPSSTGSGAEVQIAILVAGQLAGIAHQLDANALEKWLNTNPKDFNYETWCRAAIAFKRAIAKPPNDPS